MSSHLPDHASGVGLPHVAHHNGLGKGLHRLGRARYFSASILPAFIVAGIVSFTAAPGRAQEPATKPQTSTNASRDVRIERFDDWTLRCVVPPATNEKPATPPACEIAQPLMVNEDGKPVEILNLAVSRANDKAGKADWALVVLTPLDVHLASDFGFAAGAVKPSLLKYRNCNHLGCFVIVPLDRDRLAQMKKATDGTAYFRLLNSQTVKVSFSLKGFTKAFDALASGTIPNAQAVKDDKPAAPPAAEGAGN